jgi:hypothetical protein
MNFHDAYSTKLYPRKEFSINSHNEEKAKEKDFFSLLQKETKKNSFFFFSDKLFAIKTACRVVFIFQKRNV